MGLTSSVFKCNYESNEFLYNKIKSKIRKLLKNYEVWSNEEICNKLEIVYYDKLIKFNKSDLMGVSNMIGLSHNNDADKRKICRDIVEHYSYKIKILRKINNTLNKAYNRLDRSKNGPVCKNVGAYMDKSNPISDIGNILQCTKIKNSLWINEHEYKIIIDKMKKYDLYKGWEHWIIKLEKLYNEHLIKLLNIVEKIELDIDNKMKEYEFKKFIEHIDRIIYKFDKMSEIYYILAVNYS